MLRRYLLKSALNRLILAAVVCFGWFAVGVAAQQNSVTLYGIVDHGIQYDRVRQDAFSGALSQQPLNESFLGMSSGDQSGSRLGVRGNEDLGGSFGANFVFEIGLKPAQGTGFLVDNRQWG